MLLELNVKDLKNFLKYLNNNLGLRVVEGPHTVLTDSSEIGSWLLTKEGKNIGFVIAHYVDNHYLALVNLPKNANDREVLRALLEADLKPRWEVPVEPVIVELSDEGLVKRLLTYSDEFPCDEAREAYEHYLRSEDSIGRLGRELIGYLRSS